MKTKQIKLHLAASISALALGATTASFAEEIKFVEIESKSMQTLGTALMEFSKKDASNLSVEGNAVTVKNESGEAAIVCTLPSSCKFREDIATRNSFSLRSVVDQTVFNALLDGSKNQTPGSAMDKALNLRVGGNSNRTFVSIEDSFVPYWRINQKIECNATPTNNGKFEYGKCDYELGNSTKEGGEEIYQALLTSSQISSRLKELEANPNLAKRDVEVLQKLDWKQYGWKEVKIVFYNNQNEPITDGAISTITLKVFVNGFDTQTGKKVIESNKEYFDYYHMISPRF